MLNNIRLSVTVLSCLADYFTWSQVAVTHHELEDDAISVHLCQVIYGMESKWPRAVDYPFPSTISRRPCFVFGASIKSASSYGACWIETVSASEEAV